MRTSYVEQQLHMPTVPPELDAIVFVLVNELYLACAANKTKLVQFTPLTTLLTYGFVN
jgi:hypothetical protein